MATFSEKAIVDYRLLFADQGNKLLFSVSVCSKQTDICHFRISFFAVTIGSCHIYTGMYIYIYCCLKRKTEAQATVFSLIRLPFAHCAK
jgi:hypothetical protein